MKPLSQQLELFADGQRAIAARAKPSAPDEARLQAKLAATRQRVRSLTVLGMNPAVPEELREKVREAEQFTRTHQAASRAATSRAGLAVGRYTAWRRSLSGAAIALSENSIFRHSPKTLL
jgi:hypothetical protein